MSIAANQSTKLDLKTQEANVQLQLVSSRDSSSVELEENDKSRDDYMFWTDRVRKTANVDRKTTLEHLRERELCLLRMISMNSDDNFPEEIHRLLSDNISNLDMRLEKMEGQQQPEYALAS